MNDQPRFPHENDPWEAEMSDEFERRVRDLHEAPIDFDTVKGKAMNIRNKRRAAIAGSIFAAAAVIVPIAVLANGGNDRADTIPPAQQPTTSLTDTPTDTPTQEPTATDTEAVAPPTTDAADDQALGFDYLEAGSGNVVLHESDGGVIELPGPDYTDAADLGGLVAAYRQETGSNGDLSGFVDLVKDGAVTKTFDVRPPMVITPTGSAVAFVTTDGDVQVVNADGEPQTIGSGIDPDFYLEAIIGDGDCGLESGCHPFFNEANTQTEPFEINYEGPNTSPVPGAIRINDAADGYLVTAQVSYSDTGSCGVLYDRQAGKNLFKTCEAQVLDISPQADFVIGTDPYGDGIGPGYFSILDGASGDEVARYAPEQGYVNRMAWADDTHAVATVYDGANWSIVSLTTDGSIETLVGPTPSTDEMQPTYLLTGGS